MQERDMFIHLSDPSGKSPDVVHHHRVWDAERFLASQKEQYEGPKVKPGELRAVKVTTREDYEAYRKDKRA